MKQIVCELCSSTNFSKEDGMFVCRDCGTRYSAEEAKKLMVEMGDAPAPVSTTGSTGEMKVNRAEEIENYLRNARRAKDKEDWDEVEKYYNLAEQYDPTNIEAIFYSAYGKARTSLSENDIYKREAIFKPLIKSVSLINENYDVEKEAELKSILENITADIIAMCGSSFVYTQTKNGYGNVTGDNRSSTYALFINLVKAMIGALSEIIVKFPADKKKDILYIYRLRLNLAEYLGTSGITSNEFKKTMLRKCIEYANEMKALDSSFVPVDYQAKITAIEEAEKSSQTVGCIVAAVVVVAVVAFFVWLFI